MKNIKKLNVYFKVGIVMSIFIMLSLSTIYLYKNSSKFEDVLSNKNSELIPYNSNAQVIDEKTNNPSFLYLSDLTPLRARVGWGRLGIDKDASGNPLKLKVENSLFTFEKGLFAHASSELIYDLTSYDNYYKYFTSFIGINASSNAGNGVTYHFYTSNDNSNYTEVGDPIVKKPSEAATYVEIPLNNAKYLKLVINDNGANGNDHSIFADPKLVNSLDRNFAIPDADSYDVEIKNKYNNQNITNDLEFTLLKKELVKKVGKYTINSFYNESDKNKACLNWLLNNQDVLRYYILGGNPDGGYYSSLNELSRLYDAYKDDFKITDRTKYNTVLGDLYTRMAVTLSLTHSTRVALWMQPGAKENQSDSVTRYRIFKNLHKNNKFRINDAIDVTRWFENYNVEDMRFVMNNAIDDEEILWLNEYVQYKIDTEPNRAWITPHPHMAYVWPNYGNPVFYDDANYNYFNDLFSVNGKKLYDYGISRGTSNYKLYKLWMNFRNKFGTGAVCGGISKSGSNIRATHGIPATVIGQPGHAALLYYTEDAQGKGYWGIDNDVSGWTLSEKGERMLLGWGNQSFARGSYQVVYMALAQEALNDYDNFKNAEEMLMLAKSYDSNLVKKEELIRKAINIQPINIDAWYELINLYNSTTNKSENDYYNLALDLAENLKYFPLPMYHLTNLVKSKFTTSEGIYKFALLQGRILKEASTVPNNSADAYYVYQPSLTRIEANYLLGKTDNSIASFSFDGNDAGKIVLSSRFDGNGIRWDYSLDGKQTWKEVSFIGEEEHKLRLTEKEIRSITAENDIYVHIVGVDYSENNLYKIDITEGTLPPSIFASDLENRIIGINMGTEWRYNEKGAWVSYSKESPDLTGNKTVQIRQAATGTRLASTPSELYNFTMDNYPDTRKYVPVSHLSIEGVSTEATGQGGAAVNAIDGNYNTRWHSAWNGTDTERYIIIKLDNPIYLSAVEFVPAGGGNGKIYDGTIYGSMDGKNYEELTSLKNLTYKNQVNTLGDIPDNIKSFEIENPKEVQYVKIVNNRSNANWFTARNFNFYQDITLNPHPTAGIAYSTTSATKSSVIARLVNPSTKITITNNNGSDSYVFDKNGSFTFEFVDENGKKGTATANVSWIDKNIPTADIKYNLDNDQKIAILLNNISEDVYLLDKNNNKINYLEVKDGKVFNINYLNHDGNVYKSVELNDDGKINKIIYKNNTNRVLEVDSYVTYLKDGQVESEECYNKDGEIVNISDSDLETLRNLNQVIANPLEHTFETAEEYEFKLVDKANNMAIKSIKVDYDNDDIVASDLTYDITSLTNKNVKASINAYVIDKEGIKKDATVVGDKVHEFKENGKFAFNYKNSGNDYHIFEHVANVSWIDKKIPTAKVQYQNNGKEVVATLTRESEEIIIVNNGGNRNYTFKENGEFMFEFVDLAGNKGTALAKVDSLNKKTNVDVVYDVVDPTKGSVTATLVSNGRIFITNNNGKNTYTFNQNGTFTFEYIDEEGNIGKKDATVSWIITDDVYTPPSVPDSPLEITYNSSNNTTNNSTNKKKPSKKNNNKTDTIINNDTSSNSFNVDSSSSSNSNEDKTITPKSKNKVKEEEEETKVTVTNKDRLKQHALEFIVIGVLISGIIVVKSRKK